LIRRHLHIQEMMTIKTERSWMQLPLRLVIGFGFMAHGWAKLGRGPAGFAKLLHQIGLPAPLLTAWTATFLEILGGAAILTGAFVAYVSIPLMGMMAVAMFTIHARYGFSSINTIGLTPAGPQFGPPGYEVNLLYVAGLLALMAGGAGALSIDAWRRRMHAARGVSQ
jgi:putative oxidoreductase